MGSPFSPAIFRLYIDETGNADLKASDDPNHRYLSLTGIGIHQNRIRDTLFPEIESIKADLFGSHPDEPVILHRKDIVNRKFPFHVLRDPEAEAEFSRRLLDLLERLDFVTFTAVIDKREHLNKYKVWRYEPYHYCLEVLLERYVLWLRRQGAKGDVMAEVRGGRHDRNLEKSFTRMHKNGSTFVEREHFQKHLTSGKLKMKRKAANVAGLQIADLLAHPSASYVRHRLSDGPAPAEFASKLVEILVKRKYDRSWMGLIKGYGIKWLP